MRATKITAILLVLVLACPSVFGQRKAGTNAAAFLKVGAGAREVAMGSAVTTVAGGVDQMFWNPAGIALRDETAQASFSYANWLAGITHVVGAVSYQLPEVGTIGAGLITFGDTGIPATRDPFTDPATTTSYDYMDMAIQVTFARYVTDRLSLGITGKFISEKIDDKTATAVAFDVGSLYDIGILGWKVGARLTNVGSDLKYYDFSSPIPITFSMGTSLTPLATETQQWLVSADVVKQQDYLPYYNVGMEYSVLQMLYLRAGYKLNYSDTEDAGRASRNPIQATIEGWSLGGGVRACVSGLMVSIDYAFTDMKIVQDIHRFTIRLSWQ